jgi:uncharacterized metal-binding protein YceD (DUF177 family)
MTDALPLTHSYNLARLGNAGDVVTFAADDAQREAIARWAGLLSLQRLDVQVTIKKLDSVRFGLDFKLGADVTQACVVTLEPVPAKLDHSFHRELHFAGTARHKPADESAPEVVLDSLEEEGPEEISSLHYDLAAPVLEEFVLSLEPYPRRPGVEFAPPSDGFQPPESPFAVLKSLK